MNQRQLLRSLLLAGLALLLGTLLVVMQTRDHPTDSSLIAEVGYLRDTEGLDIAAIRTLPFADAGPNFSGGYDQATHWLRVRLSLPRTPQPVVIGVFPTFLDHITLIGSDDGTRWTHQQTGDAVPLAQRSWTAASLGFVVNPVTEDNVYYLRVRTKSTVQVFLTARPMTNELVHESRRMAMHALLFSMMGLAIMVSFIQTLYRATLANVLLAVSSLSYLVYSVFLLGYAAVAHPQWDLRHVSMGADVLYFVAAASSVAFHRHFLTRMRPWRGSLWFADVLALACLLALLGYALGYDAAAFKATSIFALASVLALFAMAWTTRESGDPPLRLVRVIYSVFAFFSVGWLPVNLGLMPATEIHRFSVEIHGLMNVLLVLSLVLSRWWSMERKHAAKKARLRDAALRNAASNRAAELQDKLLNMLVHEVRNHLAIIRMSVETALDRNDCADAASVVDALERTISDCVRLAWLERGEWRPREGQADLCTVVLEALAKTGEDERIEVTMPEDVQPVLSCDGAMLRTALAHLVDEVARRSHADARIDVTIDCEAEGEDETWRVAIGAEGAGTETISFNPYDRTGTPEHVLANRSSLTLAVARGIIDVMNGRLSLGYSQRRIECILLLPANSTSA